jgi:hypothetical protein
MGDGCKLENLAMKKITVAKSEEVKTKSTLAESTKRGYDSKSAVFLLLSPLTVHTFVLNPYERPCRCSSC